MLSSPARRIRIRLSLVIAAVGSAALLVIPGLAAPMPTALAAEAPSADEVAVAKATHFRESFGLRADEGFVQASLSGRDDFSAWPFGVPLRAAEIADLQQRVAVQLNLGPAIAFAEQQDGYAGVYLDQRDGGRPVFLFTGDDADRDQHLQRLSPDGSAAVSRNVRFSLADLTAGKTKILKNMPDLVRDGIRIVEVGPAIQDNAVEVVVEGLTPDITERIKAMGREFQVSEGSHAVNDVCHIDSCPPAKAGLKIYHGSTACTEGPYVRRANGKKVIITAGHCLDDGVDLAWFHDGDHVAHSGQNTWTPHKKNAFDPDCNPNVAHPAGCDLADTDTGVFQFACALSSPGCPEDDYVPAAFNKIAVFDGDATPRVASVISWTYSSAQSEGFAICRTGYASFNDARFDDCGAIIRANHWEWSCAGPGSDNSSLPCAAIDHEWRVDIDTTSGDSGGPYFSPPDVNGNVSLYGIATHSVKDQTCFNDPSKCKAWYTPTSWIMSGLSSEIGVSVDWFCVAADCHQPICFTWGCGQ